MGQISLDLRVGHNRTLSYAYTGTNRPIVRSISVLNTGAEDSAGTKMRPRVFIESPFEQKVIEVWEGCTSPSAVNYDAFAEINDGTCIFTATGEQIDSALYDISNALNSFKNGENMDFHLIAKKIEQVSEGVDLDVKIELFSKDGEITVLNILNEELIYASVEGDGVIEICSVTKDECFVQRNYADDFSLLLSAMTYMRDFNYLAEPSSDEMPSGAEADSTEMVLFNAEITPEVTVAS